MNVGGLLACLPSASQHHGAIDRRALLAVHVLCVGEAPRPPCHTRRLDEGPGGPPLAHASVSSPRARTELGSTAAIAAFAAPRSRRDKQNGSPWASQVVGRSRLASKCGPDGDAFRLARCTSRLAESACSRSLALNHDNGSQPVFTTRICSPIGKSRR